MFQGITECKREENEFRRSHHKLEIQVQERTEELAKSDEELQNEIAERKQTEKVWKDLERQLSYLPSQLITAQENERKRIALEINDNSSGPCLKRH